jgi:polyhydroxybutyrate depolymerase
MDTRFAFAFAFALALPAAAAVGCGSSTADTAATSSTSDITSTTATSGTAAGGAGPTTTSTGASAPGAGGGATTGSASGGGGGVNAGGAPPTFVVGGVRPATVYTPPSYDGSPAPLFMMLHGYGATGDVEEFYLHLAPEVAARGAFYVYPTGTVDPSGENFWNATDACCNFYGSTVDDDAYLTSMIDEIASKVAIDPKRVFLMGHSNGGFMTYRMACNHADKIAGIAVLAGDMVLDVSECNPSAPVSVLHIQGTADTTVAYNGGSVVAGWPPFPGATTSVGDWVTFDQCNTAADTSGPPMDIEASLPGAETTVSEWHGCAQSTDVQLWTIQNGSHIPNFQQSFAGTLMDWVVAHPKP